ncbi:MAG: hypothetical protein GOMPHAMPRED_002301 [Gomphillus americanus]|uniref:Uncharacterized protein n=1 Tax=Gomphillus americanus TaxID=1940652 RepID=A0A8H3FIC9_9LECA|nr:MAG: hypothetical protein GOMPHAMPRED_002301 [Gomphillus americanus]
MAKATLPLISSPSSTNLPAISSMNHTNITAIAAGVIVPVIVIIASILLWWFLRWRSRRSLQAEAHDHRRDELAPRNSSLKNWSSDRWPNILQELPGDSGASEMGENSISRSELPTVETFTLSPLNTTFPTTESPSSPKRDDMISPLSARDRKRRFTHELPRQPFVPHDGRPAAVGNGAYQKGSLLYILDNEFARVDESTIKHSVQASRIVQTC